MRDGVGPICIAMKVVLLLLVPDKLGRYAAAFEPATRQYSLEAGRGQG